MKYLVKTKYQQISENTTVSPEDFGGWQIVNVGDTPAIVNGIRLDPQGAVVGIDFTHLDPSVLWSEDIKIIFDTLVTTKQVVLTRLKYTKVAD